MACNLSNAYVCVIDRSYITTSTTDTRVVIIAGGVDRFRAKYSSCLIHISVRHSALSWFSVIISFTITALGARDRVLSRASLMRELLALLLREVVLILIFR